MKRIIAGLALLCTPIIATAQASYQFTNFATFTGASTSGFTATLMFRNVNTYTDPTTVIVDPLFYVGASARVRDICGPVLAAAPFCLFGGSPAGIVGAVQRTRFTVGGQEWVPSGLYQTPGCSYGCTSIHYEAAAPNKGLLGCRLPPVMNAVPGFPGFYAARTCDADGFTGALAVDVRLDIPNMFYARLVGPLTVADVGASFTNTVVTPEPSVLALVLLGCLALAFVHNARRPSKYRIDSPASR